MSLPLSKTLDPADFDQLTEELQIVDAHFTAEVSQHPMRRWEYALALRAYVAWGETTTLGGPLYDVGGSGSPFYRMLDPYQVRVVDPQEPDQIDLAELLHQGPKLGAAVFCLSVLEHVEDLDQFLYHLGCLVAPGGLLFLTMDYCDDPALAWPEDRYHFHWMRRRIFNAYSLGRWLSVPLFAYGFQPLGATNFMGFTPAVYNYSFCSLALTKRA